jgi:MFS family permease
MGHPENSPKSLLASSPPNPGQRHLLVPSLMLGHLSLGFTFTAFASALPQIALTFGGRTGGELVAQMTVTFASLGVMIGAFFSGWILQYVGSRATMIVSLLCYGIMGSCGLWLTDSSLLLASRFLVGFSCACMITVCVSGIADQFEGHARTQLLGISGAAASFGALTAILIGGALAHSFGWRMAFVQYPVFAGIGLLIAFAGMPPAKPSATMKEPGLSGFLVRILPLYLLATVLSVMMFMGTTQFAFLLHADGVRDPTFKSLIMGSINLIAALTSAIYGYLEHRMRARGVFIMALCSMAVSLFLIGGSSSPMLAACGAAFMGLYVGVIIPYLHHMVTVATNPLTRPRAIGLLNTFNFLGAFLNPLLLAPVGKAIGLRGEFSAGGAFMILLVIATVAMATWRHRNAVEVNST